jgi:hypothetical protein
LGQCCCFVLLLFHDGPCIRSVPTVKQCLSFTRLTEGMFTLHHPTEGSRLFTPEACQRGVIFIFLERVPTDSTHKAHHIGTNKKCNDHATGYTECRGKVTKHHRPHSVRNGSSPPFSRC